jgi:hypothetical protein
VDDTIPNVPTSSGLVVSDTASVLLGDVGRGSVRPDQMTTGKVIRSPGGQYTNAPRLPFMWRATGAGFAGAITVAGLVGRAGHPQTGYGPERELVAI